MIPSASLLATGGSSASNASLNDFVSTGYAGTAYYQVHSNGSVYYLNSGTPVSETWLLSGPASDFEVQLVKTGGNAVSGSALSTWIPVSSNPQWSANAAPGFHRIAGVTVSIRSVSTGVVLTSVTGTLDATG